MIIISLKELLEENTYGGVPVTVHWYRVIKTEPTIMLQVGLTVNNEQPSQTYIEFVL